MIFKPKVNLKIFSFLILTIIFATSCGSEQATKPTVLETIIPSAKLGFVQDSSIKSRLELLKNTASNINDWDTYATDRYKTHGAAIKLKLKGIAQNFVQLLVDAGVVVRLDDFVKFVSDKNLSPGDPWKAREEYSKHLGKKTWLRGLAINANDFDNIKKKGIQSRSLRESIAATDSLKESIIDQIINRLIVTDVEKDSLLSVTKKLDIAASVPCAAEEIDGKSKSVFVYYFSIPTLDLIHTGQKRDWFDEPFKELLRRGNAPSDVTLDSTYFSADVESFIHFQVEVSELEKIEKMAPMKQETCQLLQEKEKIK